MLKTLATLAASAACFATSAIAAPIIYDATSASHHSAWLPVFKDNILANTNDSKRFDFDPAGRLTLNDDGSGSLTGVVVNRHDPSYSMRVTLELQARTGAGSGGPKKELNSRSYVENGGPIDTATWDYYDLTGGTLEGLGSLAGLNLDVFERPWNSVHPLQMGNGANGKNEDFGLAVWFYAKAASDCTAAECQQFASHQIGDFNLNLTDATPTPLPAAGVIFLTGLAGFSALRRRGEKPRAH